MKCPTCGSTSTTVVDSHVSDSGVQRARACPACGARFATLEQLQEVRVLVSKRDGRREDFSRQKLRESLRLSARKRNVPSPALDAIVEDVEQRIAAGGRDEVPSRLISEIAIGHLRVLDPIAYIRYASAYRHFVSIEDMLDELDRLAYSPMPPVEQPRLFDELPATPTPIESAPSAAARR